MEEVALISLMSILVLLSATCSIVLGKLKMPSLIGFLVAGIIIANTMTLTDEAHTVIEVFSNLGLILLMFSIGMEIDVRKLRSQGKFAIIVALIQLPLMVVGGIVTGHLLGYDMLQSLCLGCIISGSSTAVVMAVLKQHGKLSSNDVETLVLIVIMEDIGQVIMLSMLTPMLTGGEMSTDALIVLIIEIAIFMIACFTVGLYVVPRVINWFYKRTNEELISLLCIGAAFTLAWAANGMGLSVAIGAFLCGVFVGTTKPHHTVEHFVEPLKSVFMSMFFISIGMEVVLGTLADNIVPILVIFAAFVICKTATVFLGYWVGNGDNRVGFISAVSLCAMGEFAFIIAREALNNNVVDTGFYSSVIGAALLSMIALPFISKYADTIYDKSSEKMPRFILRITGFLTRQRDAIYSALDTMSKTARVTFTKGLASAYGIIVLVIVIEVIFYYAYDPLCSWLVMNFGANDHTWRFTILVTNLLILLYPLSKLITTLRLGLYVMEEGKKQLESHNVPEKEDALKFHEVMSPLILGFLLDIVIVLLVPNGIDNKEHMYVCIVLIIVLTVAQLIKFKMKIKGPEVDLDTEDEPEKKE